jgi:hypothetical protein
MTVIGMALPAVSDLLDHLVVWRTVKQIVAAGPSGVTESVPERSGERWRAAFR